MYIIKTAELIGINRLWRPIITVIFQYHKVLFGRITAITGIIEMIIRIVGEFSAYVTRFRLFLLGARVLWKENIADIIYKYTNNVCRASIECFIMQ